MGYRVTVFEAMPHAGGMLRYGIPAYRLPRDVIDCQVGEIEALGVEFRYSTPLRARLRRSRAEGARLRGDLPRRRRIARTRSANRRQRRRRRNQGDRLPAQYQSRLPRSAGRQGRRYRRRPGRDRCGTNRGARAGAGTRHLRRGRAQPSWRARCEWRSMRRAKRHGAARWKSRSRASNPATRCPR